MYVTILGAGGFLGRKLATRLAADGKLAGRAISGLTLLDLARPPAPEAPFPVVSLAGDLTHLEPGVMHPEPDVIFHLAAVVSAAAEADYDAGMRVNLGGAEALIAACRRFRRPPRVVFTSSVASFSGGQNAVLEDTARQVPANSYGTAKAAAELLLADATRRGFLDAVSLRLPTVVVRPGRPNKAASSFVSAIIREPLLGLSTTLPVGQEFALWIASPKSVIRWLLHAAALDGGAMGLDRGVNPPGISVTVREMLAALDRAKSNASALVRSEPDARIAGIVGTWPAAFAPRRALRLGFTPHEPLNLLVNAFITDDLAATQRERSSPH